MKLKKLSELGEGIPRLDQIFNPDKAGCYHPNNPKIDIFNAETKAYLGSTNWFKTCREVKARYEKELLTKLIVQKSKR